MNCTACKTEYYGPSCQSCPKCVNGVCLDGTSGNGSCSCNSGWNGTLCDVCAEGFYGPNCLPIPVLFSISPTFGFDIGGTNVSAIGDNFNSSGVYNCVFNGISVNATWVSKTQINCSSSPSSGVSYSNKSVPFELLWSGIPVLDESSPPIQYFYQAYCSNNVCIQHGTCLLGGCVCNHGWQGSSCSSCAPTFYTSSCIQIPALRFIAPLQGPAIGGTYVNVTGDNFVSTTGWQCKFGNITVNATWISTSKIMCGASPALNSSLTVAFYLLLNSAAVYDANSPNGTAGSTFFQYLKSCTCQNGGICASGGCVCLWGWTGQNCTDPQIALVFQTLYASYNVTEFNPFVLTPILLNGTGPISWTLITAPNGMNLTNGTITWPQPTIEVSATAQVQNWVQVSFVGANAINRVTFSFMIYIIPSYTCYAGTTTTVSANYNPNYAISIPIIGNCTFISNNSAASNLPVKIFLINKGVTSILSITNTSQNGAFEVYYYPSSFEAGNFSVGAIHPLSTAPYVPTSSFILNGLAVQPSVLSISGLPGWLYNQASLTNLGDVGLTNLTYQVHGTDSILKTVSVHFMENQTIINPTAYQTIQMNISTFANSSWHGTIGIQFFVNQVAFYPTLTLSISYQPPIPILQVNPTTINQLVARGQLTIATFAVANVGLGASPPLQVNLPNGINFLSLVSPTVIGVLQPSSSSTVTLSLLPAANQTFETFAGTISVTGPSVGVSIGFKFEIVSSNYADLLVIVEDEFTFYAPGQPLVNDSIVTLTNLVTNQQYIINPCNGSCYFGNISENVYKIQVSGIKFFKIFLQN